jgi:membrane protein
MRKIVERVKAIVLTTIDGFSKHGIFTYAASIGYYTIFSLPGLLITIVALGGIFLGQEAVQGHLVEELKGLTGQSTAEWIQQMLSKFTLSNDLTWQTILGIGTLLFSATTIFVSLQEALNRIWDVQATPKKGVIKFMLNRVISFGMIISLGFIMLISFLLDTLLKLIFGRLQETIGSETALWVDILGSVLSFGLAFLVVSLIFKVLPDVQLTWRNVLKGALITTILLMIGKYVIGLYINQSNFAETYDAAGSFIVLLVWVYYSAIVLFVGAEITRSMMIKAGKPIRPAKGAKKIRLKQMNYEEYMQEK